MYHKVFLSSLTLTLFDCRCKIHDDENTDKATIDKTLQVIIQYEQSYKIDVMQGIYTVFFIAKPPLDVKFELSPTEKMQIIAEYYSLSLYKIDDVGKRTRAVYIEDRCMDMPKLYTFLTVKRGTNTQKIQIDEYCEDYGFTERRKAKKVKEFIQFINKIVKAKPQLENVPISDIVYM